MLKGERMKQGRIVVQRSLFLICIWVTSSVFAQENLPDIVERISPSVVVILTYDETGDAIAQGSGFFVNGKGDVITNYHVIEGASSFDVKTSDGKLYPVTSVLAEDSDGDLAVLAVDIPSEKVRALSVNSVLPRIAESIIVIGCPLGLELTVSDGIVSAVRNIESFGDIVQITAPISPGSSGGPVIDMKGNVIGVAKGSIIEGQNLNFAIPSERVSSLVASVVRSAPKRILSEPTPEIEAAESLYQAGLNLVWAEEYEKALTKFQQAVRIKPDFAKAYFYIGYCNSKLGRDSESLQAYEKTIQLKPDIAEAWRGKGDALVKLERYTEALQAYEMAIQLQPDDPELWFNKGVMQFILERHSESLQSFETAIQLRLDDAEAWYFMGMTLGILGRNSEALQAYEKAIQLKPDNAEAWYRKGNALGMLERYSESLLAFDQAIHLKQDYAEAWLNKSFMLHELGRDSEAFEAYEEAVQLNPDLEIHTPAQRD